MKVWLDQVTMLLLASGNQVCCILWVQVAMFNKGVGFFYVKRNTLHWIYFVKNAYKYVYVDVANMLKKTVNDVPMNNYELLNIQARQFIVFWDKGCTQSIVVSRKYWVVPLISTKVSGYSQVILLFNSSSL